MQNFTSTSPKIEGESHSSGRKISIFWDDSLELFPVISDNVMARLTTCSWFVIENQAAWVSGGMVPYEQRKKPLLLSIESWLVNRDFYNGLL